MKREPYPRRPNLWFAIPSPRSLRGEGQGEGSLRWWILVFTSIALFGNYYVYDSIAPVLLQRQLAPRP